MSGMTGTKREMPAKDTGILRELTHLTGQVYDDSVVHISQYGTL